MTIYVEGKIRRVVQPGDAKAREVEIPFSINHNGWFQWGHDTFILGENVELMELINAAVHEVNDLDPDDEVGDSDG